MYFTVDLTSKLRCPIEVRAVDIKTYEPGTHQKAAEAKVNFCGVDVQGRTVLFVDDIDDKGHTGELALTQALDSGATAVYSAAFIYRDRDDKHTRPDFVGIDFFGDNWLVGYGMDNGQNLYRNRREIGEIPPNIQAEPPLPDLDGLGL